MLSIAICDDDLLSIEKFVNVLKSYLVDINIEYRIDIYDDTVKMLTRIINGFRYDIYVCDIEMPIHGDQLISEIRRYDNDFLVAFVSYFENRGNIVCRARGDAYIYKSMSNDEMIHEIKYLLNRYFNNKKDYVFRTVSGPVSVELRKIKYIESRKRKIIVHIFSGSEITILDHTLSSLEHDSSFSHFSRVGRSYLINYQGVIDVESRTIYFQDGEELQFSREKIKQFQNEWQNFLFDEMKL